MPTEWEIDDALRARRVLIVVGKGGVGKTTVTAALAVRASQLGRRVLVADVEGKHELARLLGGPELTAAPAAMAPTGAGTGAVHACTVAPDAALVQYLDDHGLRQLSKRLVASGAVDVIATAAPGIKDLLVLGRIKAHVHRGEHDLVIVDTPASGHAVSFLLGPRTLAELVQTGSIRRQAEEVLAILGADDCEVVLVTLPEETPVNETVETAEALRDRVGIRVGGLIVNAMLDPVPNAPERLLADLASADRAALGAALTFERSRLGRQREQLRRLGERLALPTRTLPIRPSAELDANDVAELAGLLGGRSA